jgi:serine/threonine protein kinase
MQCHQCNAVLPLEARFCLACGTRLDVAVPEADVDPLLDSLEKAIGFQYRIERLLGRGGMGAVYLAHELALDRDVAIKVLPPEQASTPFMRERFRREARTAARLSHPHIVPLHTFGEVSGLVYFVMGYIGGESLASRLKHQGALESEEARRILVAMCDGLDYAHRQGIVHRDIKPDNILIDGASGAPLLTDFGIAKPPLAEAQLTTTGQLIGTPHYMSPEQAQGRPDVDARSDLYSLGIVAYEMLSGSRPFDADSPLDALTQRLTREPKPLGSLRSEIPSDLALAVDRCLQRDPSKRWPDAKSLREALLPSEEEEADYSPPVRVLHTISTVALPLALVAFGHLKLFAALNPDFLSAGRLTGLLIGVVTALVMVSVVTVVRLRFQGLDLKRIMMKALQQPSWSRSWYPRSFRRRGDVWDRLPRRLRQFRTVKGLLLTYMFAVFLPLQLTAMWTHSLPTLRQLLWGAALANLLLMFVLRQRAVKDIRARSGATVVQASAWLNTPTWRLSTWRRPPTSSLLRDQAQPLLRAGEASDAALTGLADRVHTERPTQRS